MHQDTFVPVYSSKPSQKTYFIGTPLFIYMNKLFICFPFFFREIVSNALALGEIQSSKFDADLSQHEYTPEAPVTHYARYTGERIKEYEFLFTKNSGKLASYSYSTFLGGFKTVCFILQVFGTYEKN